MKTLCIWATDSLWRQEETETSSLSNFLLWIFCLPVLADFSDSFNVFFFLPLFGLSIFIFPLSSQPFWHLSVCLTVCLYSRSFSGSLSLIHLLSLTLSLSASFHLFLYLSQWELMWPLCAVSSLRVRQSSSAPIRTALSGAVSTTGLPTHSSIHARHPPPTTHRLRGRTVGKRASDTDEARQKENQRKRKWREKESDTDSMYCLCWSIHLSFIHSFHLSPPSSLINCVYSKIPVFWSLRSRHS